MNKRVCIAMSIGLIALGAMILLSNLASMLFGFRFWRLWPLSIVAVGWALALPPLLVRGKQGLGAFFIPALPTMATGTILLLDSVFRSWHVWSWLWPWDVIATGLGFLFAALYMKVNWLLLPAILIGVNGLLFQFCVVSGWWSVWTVLWVIEPLALGWAFLLINTRHPAPRLRAAGVVLCGFAGLGFMLSATVTLFATFMPIWWLWKWLSPFAIIALGIALLLWQPGFGLRMRRAER